MEHMSTKEKMKNMTAKEKREYIWEYYKLPIFGVILSIFIVSSIGYYILTKKTPVLNVLLTTTGRTYELDKISNDLSDQLTPNKLKQKVAVSSLIYGNDKATTKSVAQDAQMANMTNDQKVAAMFYAKEIDIFIGEKEHFDFFAKQGGFYEVKDFPEIKVSNDKLVNSIVQRQGNDSKPYGISIKGIPYFEKMFGDTSNLVLAIGGNSPHLDKVKEFLNYIFNYK